jgi:hypothetical protein
MVLDLLRFWTRQSTANQGVTAAGAAQSSADQAQSTANQAGSMAQAAGAAAVMNAADKPGV